MRHTRRTYTLHTKKSRHKVNLQPSCCDQFQPCRPTIQQPPNQTNRNPATASLILGPASDLYMKTNLHAHTPKPNVRSVCDTNLTRKSIPTGGLNPKIQNRVVQQTQNRRKLASLLSWNPCQSEMFLFLSRGRLLDWCEEPLLGW